MVCFVTKVIDANIIYFVIFHYWRCNGVFKLILADIINGCQKLFLI